MKGIFLNHEGEFEALLDIPDDSDLDTHSKMDALPISNQTKAKELLILACGSVPTDNKIRIVEFEHYLNECYACDGVGWCEGGKALKTGCSDCMGSGVKDITLFDLDDEDGDEYDDVEDELIQTFGNSDKITTFMAWLRENFDIEGK